MKFYSAPTVTAENGPLGKPLNLVLAKREISEQGITEIINRFVDNAHVPEDNKIETKNLIWQSLHNGKAVTIGEHTLSIKK